jgi:hypothetical protein
MCTEMLNILGFKYLFASIFGAFFCFFKINIKLMIESVISTAKNQYLRMNCALQ